MVSNPLSNECIEKDQLMQLRIRFEQTCEQIPITHRSWPIYCNFFHEFVFFYVGQKYAVEVHEIKVDVRYFPLPSLTLTINYSVNFKILKSTSKDIFSKE